MTGVLKEKKWYSEYSRRGKYLAMVTAVDWFYIRYTFTFAKRMYESLNFFANYTVSGESPYYKSKFVSRDIPDPNLPWFETLREKKRDRADEVSGRSECAVTNNRV